MFDSHHAESCVFLVAKNSAVLIAVYKEQINTDPKVILAQNVYNEASALWKKNLHSEDIGTTFLQTVTTGYNERGWLKSSSTSSNLFNFTLGYNTPDAGITPQFNGNISEMVYTKTSAPNVTFKYSYDQLSRLTNSVSTGNTLNEALTYDAEGNIKSLVRLGMNPATLAYTYNNSNLSNQLQTVTNGGSAYRNYVYDANGNATSDGGSQSISYNMLNLPQTVKQGATQKASYTYDAAGEKLRNVGSDGTWDYINGIVYLNGTISFIQTEEGRVIPAGSTYSYNYNLKDHLGNVRYTFDKNPATGTLSRMQEDEYYSFGLRANAGAISSPPNRYLYNGKELQTDLSNQFDYGARC